MRTIFPIALLSLACSGGPCEYTQREYTPPPMPGDGRCVGMLAARGAIITRQGESACEAPEGDCTMLHPWHYEAQAFPPYWAHSSEVPQPRFAAISCSVRDCDAIERAIMAQGQ